MSKMTREQVADGVKLANSMEGLCQGNHRNSVMVAVGVVVQHAVHLYGAEWTWNTLKTIVDGIEVIPETEDDITSPMQ